jgi:hypothetical protein
MQRAFLLTAAAFAMVPAAASAEVVVVDARANSSTGGVGAATSFVFTAGQAFRVQSSLTDLWSAGALPRWSNANGLTGNLFATGSDESGQAAGTLIGQNFGLHNQGGLSAPFGALVARFGGPGGVYQLIGASFIGTAAGNGPLELFYWDSNNGDNRGSITFNVLAGVPEPASWAFMILGFGVVGAAVRRRKQRTSVRYA